MKDIEIVYVTKSGATVTVTARFTTASGKQYTQTVVTTGTQSQIKTQLMNMHAYYENEEAKANAAPEVTVLDAWIGKHINPDTGTVS